MSPSSNHPKPRPRKGSRTQAFGTPSRRSHDSTPFYSSRLYQGLPQEEQVPYTETPLPEEARNRIFCKTAEHMDDLPDCSVHLMVTSPPYNVGKEYDQDWTLDEYRAFLRRVWKEVYRVLVPGGRACINVANLGRRPYIPLHAFIIQDMLELGFLMRGEIIWDKGPTAASSTAWGSWRSPTNPTLRDAHEYILVFSKQTFRRENPRRRPATLSRDAFLEYTRSIWTFPPVSAHKVGHPAPFPVELPLRCIQLFTFQGEVVLDPFMGSGQTALAALQAGRIFVGYEIEKKYVELALQRIHTLSHAPPPSRLDPPHSSSRDLLSERQS